MLAVLALVCGGGLAVLLATSADPPTQARLREVALGGLVVLAPAMIVTFSWSNGGFYVGSRALVLLGLLAIATVVLAVSARPFAGLDSRVLVPLIALAAYAVWAMLSALWSDAPFRALAEFQRFFLFAVVAFLFASVGHTPRRLRWLVRGVLLALAGVCVVGLLTRIYPDVFPTRPYLSGNYRLNYPVGYSNALGFMTVGALVMALHVTCDLRERLWVRILAAAAMPVIGATLLLTLSRGAIAIVVVAAVLYAILGRPSGLLSGAVAGVPLTVVAALEAYAQDELFTDTPTSAAAVHQGHHLGRVILACAVGAALLRFLLSVWDGPRVSEATRARWTTGLVAGGCALGLVAALAVNAPSRVHHQYDRFVNSDTAKNISNPRERLSSPASPRRLEIWRAARSGFAEHRFKGNGAWTFTLVWNRLRPETLNTTNPHSIFLGALSDLGLVGLLLLVTALGGFLVLLALRIRGPDRALYAVVFLVVGAWIAHTGIDWIWHIPAASVWVFALAGAGISAARRGAARPTSNALRLGVGLAAVAVAVSAGLVALSQFHMGKSVAAFSRGDCPEARRQAQSARAALPMRSEPFEVLGYCAMRNGHLRRARLQMRHALDRDPRNWEFRYDLAVARGAAGDNPTPDLERARALDPLQLQVVEGLRAVRGADGAARRRWAGRAEPPERLEAGFPQIL